MYLITVYNRGAPTIIHDGRIRVSNAKITREKNAIDSLVFDILPNNPGYGSLTPFSTTVSVLDTTSGDVAFEGRVIVPSPSMESSGKPSRTVTCEGLMGYLRDSRQPYTEERLWSGDTSRTGIQEYVDYLLDNHNLRMPPEKRIRRGVVDVQTWKTTGNVTKGTNNEATFDILMDKLVAVFGGEMRVRRGADGMLYLDYSEMLGSVRGTGIRIARNMRSGSREVDPNRLVTRLYPRGCKLVRREEDPDGNVKEVETEDRLGIGDANHGIDYIDDADAVKAYGVIEGVSVWDDVTDPLTLMSKGERWLEDNNRLPASTTVSALDLSLIGLDYDGYKLLDWYPCYNPLLDLDEKLEIVKQVVDINEPHKSTIDLGESSTMQSKKIASLAGLVGDVEYVKSQTKTNVVNLRNTIRYTMAAIEIAEDRIVSTVGEQIVETSERIDGDITVIRSSVSTLEQTAESITAKVEQLAEDQLTMRSEIEVLPDSITASVTKAYELYVDGEIKTVNTAISKIEQTADGIKATVASVQAGYGTCTTAGSTAAKVVYAPNFTLYKGAAISVKFSYRNTAASPTMDVNGTGAKPVYVNGSPMSSDHFWGAQDVVSFVYSGSYWYVSDCGSKSSIAQLADSITLKVSKGDVSSQLSVESGSISITSNRFSWTSTYSSMTKYGALTCTSGKIGGFTLTSSSIYNDVLTLYSSGLRIKRNGKDIGLIGTNGLATDNSKSGLNFDLEASGDYMTWAAKDNAGDSVYDMKLAYARTSLPMSGGGSWAAGRLHVACDSDFHNYALRNAWIDPNSGGANGGRSATINYVQILSVDSSGNPTRWGPNAKMVFKNGLLVDLYYYA